MLVTQLLSLGNIWMTLFIGSLNDWQNKVLSKRKTEDSHSLKLLFARESFASAFPLIWV